MAALVIIIISLISINAFSEVTFDQKSVSCFNFKISDVPDSKTSDFSSIQTWCYHPSLSGDGTLFVFNADTPEVKPELSFLVDRDQNITHASLLGGEISYHRVSGSDFNPFTVPLTIPKNQKPVPTPAISRSAAEEVMNSFLKKSYQKIVDFQASEGEFSAFVQASVLPWRGFWWPYKSMRLSNGTNSPLAKYDRFVAARTGSSAGARSWENANHRYSGVWWEGHCNGWAASSVLRREPRFSKRDSRSGVVFSVADQKGILAETDYCAATSFFGNRYRGRSTDNRRDIVPSLFHKTITYYIGNLRKPVIIDYRSDSPVDNHPVSAYKMNIRRMSNNMLDVTATLTFHRYDKRANHPPGIAPAYTRVYRYTLREDNNGRIVGGSWKSANPDFIWVPLAIRDCNRNNPRISHSVVAEILRLPSASGFEIDIF